MDSPEEKNLEPHGEKHFHRYLSFAESLISAYNGSAPFHHYIRNYFSSQKKHGSKDRRQISSLCYNYFRLGHGVTSEASMQEKILFGTFLCDPGLSPVLAKLRPQWLNQTHLPLELKLELLKTFFDPDKIFPFPADVSEKIQLKNFNVSFLKQPDLFLRIRPGKGLLVLKKLQQANLSFEKINETCLVFHANEKLSSLVDFDKDVVVQDYNSQRVGEFLPKNISARYSSINLWDCCAGSGGKSILAFDFLKNLNLTVTDKRPSMIQNLRKRFLSAGIKNFEAFDLDLSSGIALPFKDDFKIIIADVPCSGSGTWSRTPEQLCFFQEKEIQQYAALQKKIIQKIVPQLAQDGYLFYITCSVFKNENEENVNFILENYALTLLQMQYLEGYEMKADTLFVAVFHKAVI